MASFVCVPVARFLPLFVAPFLHHRHSQPADNNGPLSSIQKLLSKEQTPISISTSPLPVSVMFTLGFYREGALGACPPGSASRLVPLPAAGQVSVQSISTSSRYLIYTINIGCFTICREAVFGTYGGFFQGMCHSRRCGAL